MGTDEAETQGDAWVSHAALPNQTLWQASLPTRLFPTCFIRYANAPAFSRLVRDFGNGKKKTQGCVWLAKRGDVLRKQPKARLRGDLQKSCTVRAANNPRDFSAS